MEAFAERLLELRKNKNLSQMGLSKETGISQTIIAQYERNKVSPTAEMIVKIADYFQVTTDYLLGREDYATGIVEVRQPEKKEKTTDPDTRKRIEYVNENFQKLVLENQLQVLGFIQALIRIQEKNRKSLG